MCARHMEGTNLSNNANIAMYEYQIWDIWKEFLLLNKFFIALSLPFEIILIDLHL